MTKCLVAFVFGKIEFYSSSISIFVIEGFQLTVEACMRTWKSLLVAIIAMDVESTKAVHTLELSESVERYFASSCDEL